MDIVVGIRPRTVYVAQDPVWPRWQFILGFVNRSAVEWTLEECTLCADPPRPGADPAGRSVLIDENLRGSRTLAPGSTRRLLVQEAKEAGKDAPGLRLTYSLVNDMGARYQDSLSVPLVPRKTLALDFPLDGRWATGSARSDVHGLGMSFAFDFVVEEDMPLHLNEDPRVLQPHEFATFGRPLYAPMDGRVVAVETGQPDLAVSPAGPSTFSSEVAKGRPNSAIVGNYVLIQTPDGSCALLAHMKRGSALVKAGDIVIAGRQIGLVGNSGNSTGAHLHIEVLDDIPDLNDLLSPSYAQSGVPFGFRNARVAPAEDGAGDPVVPVKGEIIERVGRRPAGS
jgi:murein DD-endopeptidase MepM/ murein hydrolase activator NlpD